VGWWITRQRRFASEGSRIGAERGPGYRPALAGAAVILLVAVLKITLVEPYTGWFRRQSPPESPIGMQYPVHVQFANGVELIGYDLPQGEARQGDALSVRLYWRALKPGAGNGTPFVHLDRLDGNLTWAKQSKLNPGDKPMASWPGGFFVVDDYQVPVPGDAPPVAALVRVGLLDPKGDLIPLADGGSFATLGRVHISPRAPLAPAALAHHEQTYRLGDAVRLAGYDVRALDSPSRLEVVLYWQTLSPVTADFSVFVQARDAAGRQVGQQDGPPVDGSYPSSTWATGQIIPDRHVVPLPVGTPCEKLRLFTGLYTLQDGQRAPVTDGNNRRLPNDEIPLSIDRP
jgi:hypothetical protein